MSASIRHEHDCPGANINRIIGRLGDPIERCRNCGRWAIDFDTEPAPIVAAVVVSRWVCGNHPDQPVTWRGTGCPACAAEDVERAREIRRGRNGLPEDY